MHERSRLALLALNVALLLALGVVLWAPRATAQSRPRGDYLMVSGEVNGASGQVLWVLDQTHEELVAIMWNQPTTTFVGIGYRNLVTDGVSLIRGRN
ncbi:MAG: hypothetical protein FJ257_04330 [Phycisphaerae bacterium]|nr:hypothetical protein [Phycisphaerae bacterium]